MTAARSRVTENVTDRGDDTPPSRAPDDPLPRPESDVEGETGLIQRVQQGDREAFDLLVRRHAPRAYAVAYRVVQHREDAEDLVQEAFIAALKNIDRFELGRPFAPWLYRIVVNRALSARRTQAFRMTESLPEQQEAAGDSPLTLTLRGEVMDRFRATLADLPERQRVVIELHDVDGFSAEEIGGQLGIAAGTVRWYVHQARRVLRTSLAPFRGTRARAHDGD